MMSLKTAGWVANSRDPDQIQHSVTNSFDSDQMMQNVAFDLDLNCFLSPLCTNT